MARWEPTTPFGRPVDPDVYRMYAALLPSGAATEATGLGRGGSTALPGAANPSSCLCSAAVAVGMPSTSPSNQDVEKALLLCAQQQRWSAGESACSKRQTWIRTG